MLINKEMIKDDRSKIIGFIETDHTGIKVAKDFYGRIVGRYYPRSGLTKDFYGRIVSRGDTLAGLIFKSAIKH